jgi:hypothetical protein
MSASDTSLADVRLRVRPSLADALRYVAWTLPLLLGVWALVVIAVGKPITSWRLANALMIVGFTQVGTFMALQPITVRRDAVEIRMLSREPFHFRHIRGEIELIPSRWYRTSCLRFGYARPAANGLRWRTDAGQILPVSVPLRFFSTAQRDELIATLGHALAEWRAGEHARVLV